MHQHHAHSHAHGNEEINAKNLFIATFLNLIISLAQIVGGIVSNSLALISDAVHNLGDTSSLFIAWLANKYGKKKSDRKRTFGYQRVEILSALLNAIILVGSSLYLIIEAIRRFTEPQEVQSKLMIIVAVVGLIANFVAVVILQKDRKKNLNIKAAYLHLIGDTLSSVAVIAGGIVMYFWEVYWLDPVITIGIGIYIFIHTYDIIRNLINILMQGVPSGIDLKKISERVREIPGVDNIHHLHVWNLTDKRIYFEAHVNLVKDIRVSETSRIQNEVEEILEHDYHIHHVTLQFEYNNCDQDGLVHSSG